ncbi:hypothetical protein O3G_MSEX008827 [Manduca sexta]|uniref:Uncharacterized protein n=1 Tax=Manduca sexta TaxID=7130 RepID=A0A922CQG4_MANSE|nr:hypothetical protein O3G_MSEX008827 [Manduca sexta]KAG6454701.1 hypothetical protein O3G_MSEX008827 [Manduca sexta]KAG6454702.1 hypothetical protein O3G_MSEX008827 [Manduca sexta]KAG6454703.1 hypothetical protein O3G_MSEX008827 [Manduca sexta]KAG6454704.1 hypothetical protein O3G_MSEX008827 [Manduca sexta]
MHPKILVLLIIIPVTSGFVDCRTACRTCRELKAEQSLLEVHCAMCEECKQRRRERLQMKSHPIVKKQQQAKLATRAAPPSIQYLQSHYPEGCPTPEPCSPSQEEYRPTNAEGQTCPPVDKCVTKRQLQYINSIVTVSQPPVTQPTTTQYMPPSSAQPVPLPAPQPALMPALLPAPMPMPLPPALPFPMPYQMPPPMPLQSAPSVSIEPISQAPIQLLSTSWLESPTSPSGPPRPPLLPHRLFPPPMPPAPPPMFYPPILPGCYCMPFMGPACHCPPFHQRPEAATRFELSFTTEHETTSTKEYLYAYVGVPRDIVKD